MKKLALFIILIVPMLSYQPHASAMEWNIDRPGSDFSNFDLPAPNPELCRDRCAQDPKCKAWTYVKPNTVQGPNPRCWLKHAVPRKRPHTCCVSGVKAAMPAVPAMPAMPAAPAMPASPRKRNGMGHQPARIGFQQFQPAGPQSRIMPGSMRPGPENARRGPM